MSYITDSVVENNDTSLLAAAAVATGTEATVNVSLVEIVAEEAYQFDAENSSEHLEATEGTSNEESKLYTNSGEIEELNSASETGKPPESQPAPIWEPREPDVLSGRGARVNSHPGNKIFRAMCFTHKLEFDAGSHLAKRRVAYLIVQAITERNGRFLRKDQENGPWVEMTSEQALQKACQVMRDYKRPDRVALRESQGKSGSRKRQRTQESTPMDGVSIPIQPLNPIIENPFGVHDHDVLCGRGAFVNGHTGNQRLRDLAMERKETFDAGNFTEKQALASEIVNIVRSLDPPGRFLKRADASSKGKIPSRGLKGEWEELSDARAIHKACQVMRDINRPDRQARDAKRKMRKQPGAQETSPTNTRGSELPQLYDAKELVYTDEVTMDSSDVNVTAVTTDEALNEALGGDFI